MGLPRKHHKLQIRMPECVGFGLLAALASLCLLSFGQLTRLNWVKADARVIGVNVPTDTGTLYSSISSTANGLSVLYEFEAGSRIVKGSWSSNCLSTPIVKTLAPDLVNTIEEMKSVHIGVLTEFAAHELLANTQATEAGSSAELAKSLRGEDFYSILRRSSKITQRHHARTSRQQYQRAHCQPYHNARHQCSRPPRPRSASRAGPPEISIRFDPNNPANSTLDYPGFNLQIPVVLANLLMILLTLGYFTRFYPSLKLQGY